jgi:hypothetical protein
MLFSIPHIVISSKTYTTYRKDNKMRKRFEVTDKSRYVKRFIFFPIKLQIFTSYDSEWRWLETAQIIQVSRSKFEKFRIWRNQYWANK